MGVALIVSSVTVAFLGFISLTLWKSIINGTNPRNGSFGIRTAATKKKTPLGKRDIRQRLHCYELLAT